MPLEALRSDPATADRLAERALALMHELFPLCRSITGEGLRATLRAVDAHAPLEIAEVPSGTPLFDWTVPPEWTLRDAYVADADGRRLIDVRRHNLHVVNYSAPVRARLSRTELEPHLHSLPERPADIPYRTTYYRADWGFCLAHAQRERLGPGPFEVVVDSTLAPGHLSLGECRVEGTSSDEALVFTHACHPSLANDNLSGVALAALLAQGLRQGPRPRLTWRIVFAPGTIGSLAWLARNEANLPRLRAGLVIGLLGDAGALHYKPSRRGNTLVDRAARLVLPRHGGRELPYEPYGYDERQFGSPGFDLPVGRLTRTPNGAYPEYHSSADDMNLIHPSALAGSLRALADLVHAIDTNARYLNLRPYGEPQLGRRGLYGSTGGTSPQARTQALLWLLNQGDGRADLIDIASRSGLDADTLAEAAGALVEAGLLRECAP